MGNGIPLLVTPDIASAMIRGPGAAFCMLGFTALDPIYYLVNIHTVDFNRYRKWG